MKVLSVIDYGKNGAIALIDFLEESGTGIYILLSGKSCFSEGQEILFMLLGFWGVFFMDFTVGASSTSRHMSGEEMYR